MDFLCYNVNSFSQNLTNAALVLGRWYEKNPRNFTIFPATPKENKEIILKYMLAYPLITKNELNVDFCSQLYEIFYAEKIGFEKNDKNIANLENILNIFVELVDESVVVKAALLHYCIIMYKPFPKHNDEMADILSVSYLFKEKVIPLPYLYLNSKEYLNNGKEDIDIYINNYLLCVLKRAYQQIEHLERIFIIKKDITKQLQPYINKQQLDNIVELLLGEPILDAVTMANKLKITRGQAIRYLHILENSGVLIGDEKQRKRKFYFKYSNVFFI